MSWRFAPARGAATLLGVGLLLVGSATLTASSVAIAAGCPDPPLTVVELRRLWDDGGFAGFMGMTNAAGLQCYGRADVRVIGFVDAAEGLGGTSATYITPSWLTESGLTLYGSANAIRNGMVNDFYVVAIPPGLGDLQARYARHWVSLTAHFDDPAARTCRGHGPKDAGPPTLAEAISACRSIMVMSSIDTTWAPDTATLASRSSVPPSGGDLRPAVLAAAALVGGLASARRISPHRRGASRSSRGVPRAEPRRRSALL